MVEFRVKKILPHLPTPIQIYIQFILLILFIKLADISII